MNHTKDARLKKGARVVTKPLVEPKQKKARVYKKRPDKAVHHKRSRAKWDEKAYIKRTRENNWSNHPRQPWVKITYPDTFKRKPQGRKPISYEERREAARQVDEFIDNSCRAPVGGTTTATKVVDLTRSSRTESDTLPSPQPTPWVCYITIVLRRLFPIRASSTKTITYVTQRVCI